MYCVLFSLRCKLCFYNVYCQRRSRSHSRLLFSRLFVSRSLSLYSALALASLLSPLPHTLSSLLLPLFCLSLSLFLSLPLPLPLLLPHLFSLAHSPSPSTSFLTHSLSLPFLTLKPSLLSLLSFAAAADMECAASAIVPVHAYWVLKRRRQLGRPLVSRNLISGPNNAWRTKYERNNPMKPIEQNNKKINRVMGSNPRVTQAPSSSLRSPLN